MEKNQVRVRFELIHIYVYNDRNIHAKLNIGASSFLLLFLYYCAAKINIFAWILKYTSAISINANSNPYFSEFSCAMNGLRIVIYFGKLIKIIYFHFIAKRWFLKKNISLIPCIKNKYCFGVHPISLQKCFFFLSIFNTYFEIEPKKK